MYLKRQRFVMLAAILEFAGGGIFFYVMIIDSIAVQKGVASCGSKFTVSVCPMHRSMNFDIFAAIAGFHQLL
jgi:hypothetical protein